MKSFQIKKDHHDFDPPDGIGIIPYCKLKRKALVVGAVFHDNCIYDPKGDSDLIHDWNYKLPGISLHPLWRTKHIDSAMISARSDFENKWLEVTTYKNIDNHHVIGWEDEGPDRDQVLGRIYPGEEMVYILWAESRNIFNIKLFRKIGDRLNPINQQVQYRWPDRNPIIYTPTGIWFGGPEPAPQFMQVDVGREWKTKGELTSED